jgi:hypothetical protein
MSFGAKPDIGWIYAEDSLMDIPKGYLENAVAHRAHDALALMQAKLAGMGIESTISINWYWYTLMVQTPEMYRALEVREQREPGDKPSKLLFIFETIRVSRDGEVPYRGTTIEEDLPNLADELMVEFKRQHDWVGRAIQRREAIEKDENDRRLTLEKLHEDFPRYRGGINCYNKIGKGQRFAVTIQDLTEEQLRTVLLMFPGESPADEEKDQQA